MNMSICIAPVLEHIDAVICRFKNPIWMQMWFIYDFMNAVL